MCNLSAHQLPTIPDQQWLTIRWRLFSWWNTKGIAVSIAYKGSQRIRYDWLWPIGGVISQDKCPKIVDTHFHNGAWIVSQSVMPIMAATNSVMTNNNLSEVWCHRIYDQTSLMLHWCSFAWWGRDCIATYFAYKGSPKVLYDWLQPIGSVISQDAWLKVVDDPLTLRWRSFHPGCIHDMQSFIMALSIIHIVLAAYRASPFTLFLITSLFFNNAYNI